VYEDPHKYDLFFVLNKEDLLLIPCTSYPLFNKNSAKHAPSWQVIPVIIAFFKINYLRFLFNNQEDA
jgi:hypothetical protein